MDLQEMLRRAEAPEALVDWAPDEVEEGYATSPSGSWLTWIAGSSGFPLDLLIRCVMEIMDELIDDLGKSFEGRDLLIEALDVSQECLNGEAPPEDCIDVAEECEDMADEPPVGYRDVVPPGFVELARAVSWVPKATEGCVAARVSLEAPRMENAQHMANILGGGSHIFLPKEKPIAIEPEKLPDDEAQASMLFVVAALAEAVTLAERTKAILIAKPAGEGHELAAKWAADRLREIARRED